MDLQLHPNRIEAAVESAFAKWVESYKALPIGKRPSQYRNIVYKYCRHGSIPKLTTVLGILEAEKIPIILKVNEDELKHYSRAV